MPPSPRAAPRGAARALAGVAGALAVVVAGCTDGPPTAPAGALTTVRTAAPQRTEAPAAPGTLVVRSTTSSTRGAKAGGRTERRETWSVADSALTRRAGVVTLRGSSPKDRVPGTVAGFLPTLVLQLPARAASAVCTNAPAWQRQSKVGDLTVIARGRGDEPWSSVEVWSAGRLVSRTSTEWERHRGNWRLVSQEDVAVGDGSRRTLVVDRSALARANDDVLPRLGCANPTSGYVPPSPVAAAVREGVAAPWSAALGPVGLARLEFAGAFRFAAEETCSPTEEEAEASCIVESIAVSAASTAVVAAGAGFWAACVSPAVVAVAPCLTASSLLTGMVTALSVAIDKYWECKQKASAPKPCSCTATPPPGEASALAPPGAPASTDGTPRPAASHVALDCTEPAPAPTGGGGEPPTSGGGGHWAEICTYEEHYDADGNYLFTVFFGCTVVWIA